MDILTKTDKLKYDRDRAKYLGGVIPNIGIIEEKDDCIICHVKQDLLEIERNSKAGYYELLCDGMNTERDEEREKVDYYNLNKPVYYVFDGIYFKTIVEIVSSFSSVIFRNCTFSSGIRIYYADDITLENNEYACWTDFKEYGNAFLWGMVRNLTIKNDQFDNTRFLLFDNNFGINIEVNRLNIDSATICAGNHGQINIKAKETTIRKSELNAPEIYLDSDSIVFDDKSSMKSNGIIIENKNCDLDTDMIFRNIDSPCVIYNGNEMGTNNEILRKKKD